MQICLEFSWNALAAISTTAAVIVALFIPHWQQKNRLISIDNALKKELEDAFLIIKDAKNLKSSNISLPPGVPEEHRDSFISQMQRARLRVLDASFWPQCRIEATILNKEQYDKYRDCFIQIIEIKNMSLSGDSSMLFLLDHSLEQAIKIFKSNGFK